jgi:hypothetical protein
MTGTTVAGPQPAGAIPGPRGLPVLGSSLDLLRDPLGTYERARQTYGDHREMTAFTLRVIGRLLSVPTWTPPSARSGPPSRY